MRNNLSKVFLRKAGKFLAYFLVTYFGHQIMLATQANWTFSPGTRGDYTLPDSTPVKLTMTVSGPEYANANEERGVRLKKLAVFTDTPLSDFTEKSDAAVFRMENTIEKGAMRLILPDTVKVGTSATIRVSTAPSVTPTFDMTCPNGNLILSGAALTATATAGIYATEIKFDANTFKCAVAQTVTVVASVTIPSKDTSKPAFAATAVGRIGLTASTLDDVLAAASSGMNAEKAAKDAKDAIKNVEKALTGDGNIMTALDSLQKNVGRLPSLIGRNQSGVTQVKTTIEEVTAKINTFVGSEGYDMRTILKQEIGEGVKGVRNQVDRTLAVTNVMKEIVERKAGKSDEPIVQIFYEIGSVKLRVVAVNPSKERPQVVPIKIYLPKEIIPDDIIEMKDLKVGYDSEKSLYYAFSDHAELAPAETRIFEVYLEDVWRMPENEITEIRDQTHHALKHLEKTEYFDRAKAIVDSIDKRINDILAKQNDDSVSREEHIGAYRTSLVVMEDVKKDIAKLEKMLQHTGAPPSIELLKDTVFEEKDTLDRITAWRLILAIIGFIGLLGAGFYLRWFLLVRSKRNLRMELLEDAPMVSEHVEKNAGVKEKSHEIEGIDIEKFLDSDNEQENKRKAG